LHRFPTLTWRISTCVERSGAWPAVAVARAKVVASGSASSAARWFATDASGCSRRSSVGWTLT
jgi:hypothetical protein